MGGLSAWGGTEGGMGPGAPLVGVLAGADGTDLSGNIFGTGPLTNQSCRNIASQTIRKGNVAR